MSSKKSEPQPALIVFGEDEDGKARAGWFIQDEIETAEEATRHLGFRCFRIETTEHQEFASTLRRGNIHAAGKKFIPVAAKLANTVLRDLIQSSTIALENAAAPKDWDAIKPGDVVIAHEGRAEGWWEAIVIKRADDTVTIRWRDYPRQSKVKRHRSQIALPS